MEEAIIPMIWSWGNAVDESACKGCGGHHKAIVLVLREVKGNNPDNYDENDEGTYADHTIVFPDFAFEHFALDCTRTLAEMKGLTGGSN